VELVVSSIVLLSLGVPLILFGWAVAQRRFDLVFGDYTADTTDEAAWDSAHRRAGRRFRHVGILLTVAAPVALVFGFPVAGWVLAVCMVAVVVGVCVVSMQAFVHVERHQIRSVR
jgi:hypothetical protein